MKFSKIMLAMENFEEAPIPESVVAVADGNTVDPQIVDTQPPVNEPATIPDAGEMPLGVPVVSPLPIIEEPIVAEVPLIPAAADTEQDIVAEQIPAAASGELIIDSPMDHDNTMDMLDQTIVETTVLNNDLGEIVETHAALEEYTKLLKQAGPDGISRQAAGFLRVGLEQFHADGHIDFSKQIASLEDMGDGEKQHLLPSNVKSSSLGDKIKEVANKIWEWLKKIWEKGKKFVGDLRNGVIGLERKLNAANKAVMDKSNVGKGEYTVPNPQRIAIGGKVNANYPDELKALTAMATKVYPERMTQFYSQIAAAIGNFDVKSGDFNDIKAELDKAKDLLADISSSDRELPGGAKIDVAESGVSYGITGEPVEVGETKAQARSGPIIMADLKTMKTVLESLKGYASNYEKMSTASEAVGKALEKLKQDSSSGDMEQSAATGASDLESQVGKLLHSANPRGNEIVRYIARTTSAYLDVILAELGANNSDNSKAVGTK